jgi:acetyl esterase/lipase
LLALSAPAFAQVSRLPSEVRTTLAEVGAKWSQTFRPDLSATRAAFEALHAAAPKDGVVVTKDVAYGPHPRNLVDVYRRRSGASRFPVVIFIHGGGYVGGDKSYYGNVTTWFARRGVLGINATYRLAPTAKWPSATEDISGMVKWTKENAAKFGDDPNKVFLIGHSAGATHVASYIFNKRLQPSGGPGVVGAVLLSGRYRVRYDPNDPNGKAMQAYFGEDASAYPDRSAITHIRDAVRIPVFTVIAEYELSGLDVLGAELLTGLCARDAACPRFTRLAKHNHGSEVFAFNTADEQLGREILEFMDRGRWAVALRVMGEDPGPRASCRGAALRSPREDWRERPQGGLRSGHAFAFSMALSGFDGSASSEASTGTRCSIRRRAGPISRCALMPST